MNSDFFQKLQSDTTEINKTFYIKASGIREGKKLNTLLGVSGMVKLIGEELSIKFLLRAFKLDKKEGKEVCKLRTGQKNYFLL
jgi:hypothetical protein